MHAVGLSLSRQLFRTHLADPRFLNIRLDGIRVEDPEKYPHMVSLTTALVRSRS